MTSAFGPSGIDLEVQLVAALAVHRLGHPAVAARAVGVRCEHDMIARRDLRHRRADAVDDPRPLVPEDLRKGLAQRALACPEVGRADADADNPYDDLVRARLR